VGASASVVVAGSTKFRRSTEQGAIWSFLQKLARLIALIERHLTGSDGSGVEGCEI
jgi:hypothetical protein